MNDGAGGAVGALAIMGTAYWFATGVAVVAFGAVLIAMGAVLAVVAVVVYAVLSWSALYKGAMEKRDRAWLFDLMGAPIFGALVAIAAYFTLNQGLGDSIAAIEFSGSEPHDFGEWLAQSYWLLLAVTFFGGLFGTAWALASHRRRWRVLAYPGFAFYSVYATLAAWLIANPV